MSCSCSTNEDLLIELTLTRTNQEIRQTKDIYLKMYDRPLLMDVLDETGGNLRRFLTRVLLGTRDEGTAVDEPEAEKAAAAPQRRRGTPAAAGAGPAAARAQASAHRASRRRRGP